MKKIAKIVAAAWILIWVFVPKDLQAAELWVDRNSLSGPCSDARTKQQVTRTQPWCTLRRAGSLVGPGDTVYVRRGDYSEVHTCTHCNDNSVLQIVASGASTARISFKAFAGEQVRILPTGGAVHGIQVIRTYDGIVPRYVTLSGFIVRDFPRDCVRVARTSDVTINAMEITGCKGGAVEIHETARVLVEGNKVHHNPTTNSTSAVDLYLCKENNVVRGNLIWANTDEHAANGEGHGIIMDYCTGTGPTVIVNNVIWDNEGWCVAVYRSPNGYIRNNTCWANGRRAGSGEFSILGAYQRIHNNILVPRNAQLALNIRTSSSYPVNLATNSSDYNILWAPTHQTVAGWGSGSTGTLRDYQLKNPYGWDSHSLQRDPLFVNASLRDFRLTAASSAIDSGTSVNAAVTDANGRARPLDGNGDGRAVVDRGAYER